MKDIAPERINFQTVILKTRTPVANVYETYMLAQASRWLSAIAELLVRDFGCRKVSTVAEVGLTFKMTRVSINRPRATIEIAWNEPHRQAMNSQISMPDVILYMLPWGVVMIPTKNFEIKLEKMKVLKT